MNHTLVKQELHQLVQSNKLSEARKICDELCKDSVDDIEAWLISASIHAKSGEYDNVADCCNKVIKLQPSHILAHYNLGIANQTMGNYSSAEENYRTTLRLNPTMRAAVVSLGQVVMNQGRAGEAIKLYDMILGEAEGSDMLVKLKANINLGLALCMLKKFSEAEVACKNALLIKPDSTDALNNLGRVLKEQGDLKGASEAHRKVVNLDPGSVVAHSNLLLDLNYLVGIDKHEVFVEHGLWAQQHADFSLTDKYYGNDIRADKRLRIGYVSPDFRAHSVMLFISGLIEKHDRNHVEVFCYSNTKKIDAWTAHIKNVTDHWCDINMMTDDTFVETVVSDKIDILVDLSGHTADNRLTAFAKKPAPIQVTWLGYPNTTGLSVMDYRITDSWADPEGVSDSLCTESLVRLPHGFLNYQPLLDSPLVNSLPMRKFGYITFGCFNNSAKVNDDVIKVWCRLLQELPESRLLLKSPQFSDSPIKKKYLSKFESAGIDLKRIEIYGRIDSTIDHLSLYHKVDVALDPFPYNGTTTTCEALWMGVPVVVLEGNTHAGRVGVSILNNINMPELIAQTYDEYINICTQLAVNLDHLSNVRVGLRERMNASPLLDTECFTTCIEAAYRTMWVDYCDS